MISRSRYTTSSVTNPFTIALETGYTGTLDNERSTFMIEDALDKTSWCLVEATIVSSVLTINRVIKTTSTSTIPVFSNGAVIFSMLDIEELSAGQGQGRDAFVFMGQSNMSGHNGESESAGMKGYDPLIDTTDGRILQRMNTEYYIVQRETFNGEFTKEEEYSSDSDLIGEYVLASDPLDFYNENYHQTFHGNYLRPASVSTGVSSAMTFCKRYVNNTTNSRQVVILPMAQGSSNVSTWAVGDRNYTNTITAVNSFLSENEDNRVVGFLFQQGEADHNTSGGATVDGWEDTVRAIISSFRTDAFTPTKRQETFEKVPFIFGDITNSGGSPTSEGALANLRIEDIVSDTPYTGLAKHDTDWDFSGFFNIHLDAVGQRAWGHLYYDAYLQALDNHPEITALPGTITNLQATESPTQILLTWDFLDGSTGYNVGYKDFGALDSTYVWEDVTSNTLYQRDGFTSDTQYTLEVRAYNDIGEGAGVTIDVTPISDTPPTQVQNVTAVDGVSGITVKWDALVHDPAVTGYRIQRKITGAGSYSSGDDVIVNVSSGITENLYTGAVEGVSYTFQVQAFNYANGPYSAEVDRSHSASPTLALSPVLLLKKGVGQSVNGTSMDWLDQSGNDNHAFPIASREVAILNGGADMSNGTTGSSADGRLGIPPACGLGGQNGDEYTVILRVKRYDTTGGIPIIGHGDNDNAIKQQTTDDVRVSGLGFDTLNTTTNFFPVGPDLQIFAVTHDNVARTAIVYDENVVQQGINTAVDMDTSTITTMYLGAASASSTSDFEGIFYDVIIFHKILTTVEIQAVYDEMTGAVVADTVPTEVQNVTFVQSGSQMTVGWDPLTFEPIVIGYTVEISTTSGDWTTHVVNAIANGQSADSYTFTTPLDGTTYYVRVLGVNSIGYSSAYTQASATFTDITNEMIADYQNGLGHTIDGGTSKLTAWADQSGKGNHGDADLDTLNNFTVTGGGITSTEYGDEALFLDDDLLFNSGSEAFTMLFDVDRIVSANSFNNLYGCYGNQDYHKLAVDTSTGFLSFRVHSSYIATTDAAFFPTGTRKTFAVTMALDGTVKIHDTDGTAVATGTGGQVTGGSFPTLMGILNDTGNFGNITGSWDGTLYNFRAYNYVRTDVEIAALLTSPGWGS